jgi:hypothetical protein
MAFDLSVKRVVDYKKIDMTGDEWAYYQKLVETFTSGKSSGSEHFRDLFDVDDEGYIRMIRPPLGREVPWAVIIFLQNLMINQHERRRDRLFESKMRELEEMMKGKKDA